MALDLSSVVGCCRKCFDAPNKMLRALQFVHEVVTAAGIGVAMKLCSLEVPASLESSVGGRRPEVTFVAVVDEKCDLSTARNVRSTQLFGSITHFLQLPRGGTKLRLDHHTSNCQQARSSSWTKIEGSGGWWIAMAIRRQSYRELWTSPSP